MDTDVPLQLIATTTEERTMKWNEVEKDWSSVKTEFKKKWNKLNDHDLDQIGGDRRQLEKMLKKKYDITSNEAGRRVDRFIKDLQGPKKKM